jgi:hypothetical protein
MAGLPRHHWVLDVLASRHWQYILDGLVLLPTTGERMHSDVAAWVLANAAAEVDLGIITGNPWVILGYPYPYPTKPAPAARGKGFRGSG